MKERREVRSEERKPNNLNPRRQLSNKLFEQRPIMHVTPQQPSKNLYYLQFLNGQPVWGLMKNSNQDNLSENKEYQHDLNPGGNFKIINQIDC